MMVETNRLLAFRWGGDSPSLSQGRTTKTCIYGPPFSVTKMIGRKEGLRTLL